MSESVDDVSKSVNESPQNCAIQHCDKSIPENSDPKEDGRSVSFFEFWPTWLIYLPVVIQWLVLSVRYRSLTLPLLANPVIPLSGMVGGSKHELMREAKGACKHAILPWVLYVATTDDVESQATTLLEQCAAQGLALPLVCKPDVGCRGAGVKLVHDRKELLDVIAHYPAGSGIICQKLSQYEPEVGIFYVKDPRQAQGDIVSLTFKETPAVVGDGVKTLAELVAVDPRAANLLELYQERNAQDWERVLEKGERYRLLFSASHCRGAVFIDAREHITPELVAKLNVIMADLPDFYYGRLDVKFEDLNALRQGETLEIVEINGASSESIHIWDKNARLMDAIKTLMWQYRTLFQIGAWHRKNGLKTPGLKTFLAAWRRERTLTGYYPETD